MSEPISVVDIDLSPIAGKTYFSIDREWREEFIYFLMVDRFQDDAVPARRGGIGPVPGHRDARTPSMAATSRGSRRTSTTLPASAAPPSGCRRCSRTMRTPITATTSATTSRIDPHFGTKQDLVELVEAAHGFTKNGRPFPIRIILDVVINHSGDNWSYPGGLRFFYSNDTRFDFGGFRRGDRPVPTELRNADLVSPAGRDAGTTTPTPRTSTATCSA